MFGSPSKVAKHERVSIIEGIAPSLQKLLDYKPQSLFTKQSRAERNDDITTQNDEQAKNDKETTETVICGRIKFAGIIVPPDAPTDLICEECEKSFAVFHCMACAQMQCERCADLVHPRQYGGAVLHPHETNERIRPVQFGDKSRITLDTSFVMPDTELRFEDLAKIRDITVPHSLAANKSAAPAISKTLYRHAPKFSVNQVMLFADPHSGADAYGKVLSEWDFRHGSAAPAVIRGEASLVCYIVQMLGPIPHLGRIDILERLLQKGEGGGKNDRGGALDPAIPVLEGLGDDPDRLNKANAHIIDKRIQAARNIQLLGPKYHLRQINKDGVAGGADEDQYGDYGSQHSGQLQHWGAQSVRGGDDDDDDVSSVASDSRSISSYIAMRNAAAAGHRATQAKPSGRLKASQSQQQLTVIEEGRGHLYASASARNMPSALDVVLRSAVNVNSYADVDTDDQSQLSAANANNTPCPAVLRSFQDVIDKQLEFSSRPGDAYFTRDHQRVSLGRNVLVLGEGELRPLEEHVAGLRRQRDEILTKVLGCSVFSTDRIQKSKRFGQWRASMEYLRARQRHFAMVRIQSAARVWLCRNKLAEKTALWHKQLEHMRVTVHGQFRYAQAGDPYAVSMDNKKYFRTLADLNRYAAFLRLVVVKIVGFQMRKRHFLLRRSVAHWRAAVGSYLEENLVMSHFNDAAVDQTGARHTGVEQQKALIAARHLRVIEQGERLGAGLVDEMGYDTVLSIPLQLKQHPDSPLKQRAASPSTGLLALTDGREGNEAPLQILDKHGSKESNQQLALTNEQSSALVVTQAGPDLYASVVPSYFPSEGIALPPLVPVFDPKSADGRVVVTTEKRVDHCMYRAHMVGPSHDSCWVVPGRLAMGPMPWGPADGEANAVTRSRNRVSAISALMLGGVDLFVSLLPPDEEEAMEVAHSVPRIASTMVTAFETAKSAVQQILINGTAAIAKQQAQIDAIPKFGKSDPRFPAAYRETLRCKARIQLSQENIKRAKSQIKNLAPHVDWLRIPLERDRAPSVNAIQPSIWLLERHLREGRNIYLYSGDGHGRVGMVAGILLGRLYGLHPYETAYRVQACHDSSKREEHRHIPITCPQLPVQRQLVAEALTVANRVLESTTVRCQVDPETFVDRHRPRPVMLDTSGGGAEQLTLHGGKAKSAKLKEAAQLTVQSVSRDQPQEYEEDGQFPLGVVRHKQSVYFEHELPPIARAALTPRSRSAAEQSLVGPSVEALYDYELGQSSDVVRRLPQKRPEPALFPSLPLLRLAAAFGVGGSGKSKPGVK